MFSIKVLYLICAATSVSVHCHNDVPVVAWTGSGPALDFEYHTPALRKLSSSEFSNDFLGKLASNNPSAIAFFLEESLSNDDFRWEDENEVSSFPQMQKLVAHKNVKFIPRVDRVEESIDSLKHHNYKVVDFDPSNIVVAEKSVFVIKLNDVKENENRHEMLRRHDAEVYEHCKLIQEKLGNAVCLYTASHRSPIEPQINGQTSRKLLQTSSGVEETSSESPPAQSNLNLYYFKTNNIAMVYTQSAPQLTIQANKSASQTNEVFSLSPTSLDAITLNDKTLNVPMNDKNKTDLGKVTLQFQFSADSQNWQLDSITLQRIAANNVQGKSILNTTLGITTSLGFSFHTPSPVVFSNDEYQLVFNSMQVEFFSKAHAVSFDVADDTVYFFTIPILSGIFVVSLLITIVLIGLSMIFDIKTMDLFDDPKGKTVTINATD